MLSLLPAGDAQTLRASLELCREALRTPAPAAKDHA